MKLGFYYHIPIIKKNNKFLIPSYLGVFIDSLAFYSSELVLVMHEASGQTISNCDYVLKASNVTWINLGLKTAAWHRAIFHRKILEISLRKLNVDYLIIRSPTPLAPYFHFYISNEKIRFFIVGDYESGYKQSKIKSLRQWAVKEYLKYNVRLFKNAIKQTNVIVNSTALFEKYKDIAPSCKLVNTTTLSNFDFYVREDTCHSNKINLLYTGRIDLNKGLVELIKATKLLIDENLYVILNIVGWENNSNKPIEKFLIDLAKELKIENNIIFHGRKTVGYDLNKMYRMADIYVIPSYHEGFPRTIWEAMANSLPVIATRVGAIPDFLTDNRNALLIPSRDINSIKLSILKVLNNRELRKSLILNGREIAKKQTLDVLTQKLLKSII
jgi:glycosyltransferase involved in cell wall biosynthesis